MSRLPIDERDMDLKTQSALDYFKDNQFQFMSMEIDNTCKLQEKALSDGYNKIFPLETVPEPEKIETQVLPKFDMKLMELKKKIEQHADFFAQIEYLIRKIPIEDVLNYDIKLIVQNILFNLLGAFTFPISGNCILMDHSTPLAHLGFVIQILKAKSVAYILSDTSTAAACHLFTKICHKVGLHNIKLVYWETRPDFKYLNTSESESGCVGVITENADIDSAVDVLAETTVQYPWKLKRILVQENVFDSFKKALQWKSRDTPCESSKKKLCTEVFNYKGKTFLVDYAGSECGQEIIVEAYRTTKELLSLLSKSDYSYMSLWTSDLSESNEISHHESTPNLVWINKFGTFDGPPATSQVLYTNALIRNKKYLEFTIRQVNPDLEVQLLEKQKKWLQLSYSERYETIFNAIIKNSSNSNESELKMFLDVLKTYESASFKSISKGNICEYYLKPLNAILFLETARIIDILVVKGLFTGSVMVILRGQDKNNILLDLMSCGAPIIILSDIVYGVCLKTLRTIDGTVTNFKVIYSNYGSIFAN